MIPLKSSSGHEFSLIIHDLLTNSLGIPIRSSLGMVAPIPQHPGAPRHHIALLSPRGGANVQRVVLGAVLAERVVAPLTVHGLAGTDLTYFCFFLENSFGKKYKQELHSNKCL